MDLTLFGRHGTGAVIGGVFTGPDVTSITPDHVEQLFNSEELDQLSAILSDFISLCNQHLTHYRALPSNPQASDLTQKWIERAADLRDRIEAR